MKKTMFLITMLLLSSILFLQNAFTEIGLPEGAKARLGKGYKAGSSIFSKDGTRFAVAHNIGVWIYDVFTGQEVALLTNHPRKFTVMASSPDGNMLASANENTIFLFETHTGRRIATLTEHTENIATLVFSPDSKILASGSTDDNIRLWNAKTGRLLFLPLSDHQGDIISIAFSPDSKILASGSTDNTIRLWSATTGQHLATLEEQVAWGVVTHEGHTGDVTAVAFSPDGATLASGGRDNKIRLWDVGTREHRTALIGHRERIIALTFSKNGSVLVSGSADDTIQLWNSSTGNHLDTLKGHKSDVVVLAFSKDGTILASGDTGNIVRLWDGSTGQYLDTHSLASNVNSNPVRAVAFSPYGTTLASGIGHTVVESHRTPISSCAYSPVYYRQVNSTLYSGHTQLWNTLTGKRTLPLLLDNSFVSALEFSLDGAILATAGLQRFLGVSCVGYRLHSIYTLQLWDARTGKRLINFKGHSGYVSSVAFSPDGKILASGSWDDTIRLWNPATGQHLTTFHGHRGNVNTVTFSPDGEILASGSADDTIRLWNSAGQVRSVLPGHGSDVNSVVFSPDSKMLATGSNDRTIRLWDSATGQHIATLEGHRDWVRSVAFSPDGGTLASGSDDRTIRLWNPTTGEHLVTLSGHAGYVNSVAFSPDGTILASGSSDGTILLWEMEPAVSQDSSDVNGDGVVNILDLAAVVSRFGQTGQNPADVNGDGVVNVTDLILVASAMQAAPAAPSIHPQVYETFNVTDVQEWLTHAKQLQSTDARMQRGIAALEQLLEILMQAEALPTETTLLSNYPNPFNPETWIPYQLAEAADVTVTLYAADGKLVRTLVLGYQPAGAYQSRTRAAYWDGRNELGEPVASGIYFYTLTAGKFTATRKMLIVK